MQDEASTSQVISIDIPHEGEDEIYFYVERVVDKRVINAKVKFVC